MDTCSTIPINLINDTEYIGDSLSKINNNFKSLQQGACTVESLLNSIVNVRTFFYYGPNAPINMTAGANGYDNDNAASRPSDTTIQTFVNDQLNLEDISGEGDIVYVIYQKTGWYSGQADYIRSGKGTVPYRYYYTVSYPVYKKIGINHGKGKTVYVGQQTETRYATGYAGYTWSQNLTDQYSFYNPIYVIYKLIYQVIQTVPTTTYGYVPVTDAYWPKYVKSQTNSIINWNDPRTWSTY